MSAQREPEWFDDDGATFEESLKADPATLAHRGFTSDFCGAWLALWQVIERDYAAGIEAALNEPAAPLIEAARSSYMALVSAAARDTSKSQRRRFKIPGGVLWAYRSGAVIPPRGEDGTPEFIERRRVLQNFARYWRGAQGWRPVYRFQKATRLALFERDYRTFKDNSKAAEAASYVDNLTDLIGEIIGRKKSYRGRTEGRPEKFMRAAVASLDSFRRRVAPFAPDASPEKPEAGTDEKTADTTKRRIVIDFGKAKEKILAGVEIARARAAAGRLTRDEATQLLDSLAPLVEIAEAVRQSSEDDAVTSEDFEQAASESSCPSTSDVNCDFPAENAQTEEGHADKFIRVPPLADVTLDAFLAAFRPTPADALNLRAFKPKGAPDEDRFAPRLIPTTRRALSEDAGLLSRLRKINEACGLYFVVNQGGDCDEEINRITAFFAEADDFSIAEQHAKLDACPLPPSVRVETLKSVHAYWLAVPGCAVEEWREVQRRLIHYFGSDVKIKNPARVMRLPDFNHVTYTSRLLSYKTVELVQFDPSRRYTAAELMKAFPAVPEARPKPVAPRRPKRIAELTGDFEAYKRELGARISEHPTARRNGRGKWDCKAVCHDGKGGTGLFFDPAQNFVWCNSGCTLSTIAGAFGIASHVEAAVTGTGARVRGTL
jgi:hypothetical protein